MDKDQAAPRQVLRLFGGERPPAPDDTLNFVRGLALIIPDQKALIAHLSQDPCLPREERTPALDVVRNKVELSSLLNDASWYVVRSKECSQDARQRGLEVASEASRLAPHDGLILNTFGVAQYRVGRYLEALKTLGESDVLNKVSWPGGIPADVAFLAMCHARLGHSEQAKSELARLERLMNDKGHRPGTFSENKAFYEEAIEVVKQHHANPAE
jgi:hypothetical protein